MGTDEQYTNSRECCPSASCFADADIFDLLDVSEREDSYTSLIASLLRRSEPARRAVFDALSGCSFTPATIEVRFRRPFPSFCGFTPAGDLPDLLLVGKAADGRVFWLLLEMKLLSGEGWRQTRRYVEKCEQARIATECNQGAPFGFRVYFVTLLGDPPECRHCDPLTHGALLRTLEPKRDVVLDPLFQLAWGAYAARLAELDALRPRGDEPLLPWLNRSRRFGTPDLRCRLLARSMPLDGWAGGGGLFRAAKEPGYVFMFWRPEWASVHRLLDDGPNGKQLPGASEVLQAQTDQNCPPNYFLHFEFDLPAERLPELTRVHLHFETNPYRSRKQLAIGRPENAAIYRRHQSIREAFRVSLQKQMQGLAGDWRPSRRLLQMAFADLRLPSDPTVGEFQRVAWRAIEPIAPIVTAVAGEVLPPPTGPA